MKKTFVLKAILLSLFIIFRLDAIAQVVEPPKKDTTTRTKPDSLISKAAGVRASNLYFEVGGAGLALTINYDVRFKHTRNGFGYRVGYGYFADGGNTVFTLPLQINYLAGNNTSTSFFEAGGGTTFLNSTGDNKGKVFIFDRVTGFVGTITIGYRYQPIGKGFNFRIAFVPVFYDEGVIPAGGVSFGYTFK